MKTLLLASLLSALQSDPDLEGARLHAGESCYAIVMGDRVVGSTLQTVTAAERAGAPVWDIVIHQKLAGGRFDLRDHFIVDRETMLPLTLDSRRGGDDRATPGWQSVEIEYIPGRVLGRRETAAGVSPIDVSLSGQVWDGNLWGLTVSALPLRDGEAYQVPFWQYDKGFQTFSAQVVGSQRVETPAGTVDAWVVDAGPDPDKPTRYLVSKETRQELGYAGGPGGQRLDGDCSGMERSG